MVEPAQMGADITYHHMLPSQEEPSEIQKFYENKNIFITGATGFLGHLLIQKLIRSCSKLTKIYILIREKNGKSPEVRYEEMLKNLVFEKMVIEQRNFREKIQIIRGDCEKQNLGLNEADTLLLQNEINIIFHLAAVSKYDKNLKVAAIVNVEATKNLLNMAKNMQNLNAFIYVSTVYSHCLKKNIDEQFYEVPVRVEKFIKIINILNSNEVEVLTSNLLQNWPNIYTFTKAVAENVIQEYGKGLPIAIIRPSTIISTYNDPLSGWVNSYYGPVGIIMAGSVGLLRSFLANPDKKVDLVPADYVVNMTIVSAWEIGKIFYNDSNNEFAGKVSFDKLIVQNEMPIFNYVCSPEKEITWGKFMSFMEINNCRVPANYVLWYYCFTMNSNYFIHKMYTIFLHLIPAYIVDTILYIIRKKPVMVQVYKKLHTMINNLGYFSLQEWNFKNNNTQTLWKKLNTTDQRIFGFSMQDFFWNDYCYTFMRGARVYLLKESMDTLPQAKKRYKKLKIAHYSLVLVLCFFILSYILKIIYIFM